MYRLYNSEIINSSVPCPNIIFKTLHLYYTHFDIVEPTNNIPPKKTGDMGKFTGSQDMVLVSGTSWLTCQVTGFPVPRYL